MLSDNTGNLIAANKELSELSKIDIENVKRFSASKGIKWTFMPPLAPHFGGVHETLIKATRRAMNAVIKKNS